VPSRAPTPPVLLGGAYEIVGGLPEGSAIPPGYALVPPNLLVPLSSLQTNFAAANQAMPQARHSLRSGPFLFIMNQR
jgi:hypothetical protein